MGDDSVPALSIAGLEAAYGKVPVLHGVSLDVYEGEAVSIVGPNGAGKTTLLRCIAGLHAPSDGEISLLGSPITGLRPDEVARRGIATVPEGRNVFGKLTVRENLELAGIGQGRSRDSINLDEQIRRFPVLGRRINAKAGLLSGGEQQQLAITRALVSQPKVLLLDEPSLGLAPKIIDEVFAVLESLRREGVTMLLVEQAAWRSIAFADRTYLLRGGAVVLEGTRDELEEQRSLVASHLGLGTEAGNL